MLKNYLKISFRNLKRDTSYSLINILGLAVGIAACLLISLYVLDELSYDRFHKKSERIHRLYIDGRLGNNVFKTLLTPNPARQALVDDFSQVEAATHFFERDQIRIEYEGERFIENDVYYAGPGFFEVFTFPLVKGDPEKALAHPHQVVLTESTARKYFGGKDPMGEMIDVGGAEPYRVTGVCRDVPHNSHFHFDFLVSYSSSKVSENERWANTMVYTYLVLKEGVDPLQFEQKLDLLVEKYLGPEVEEWTGIKLEEFIKKGNSYEFFIQPLEEIYLHSDLNDELEPVSNISRVWYFSIIAVFILLIACINFMNLATAKYSNRAREVGIRKVVGSRRRHLISQFLTESILVSLLAVVIAVVLVELALPVFNSLALKDLSLEYFTQWYLLPGLLLLGIVVGVLAGTYPSFFLSSFSPLRVLKKDLGRGIRGSRLRGALVVSQFVITIVLIISTVLIYQQHHFMTHKKLGFNKDEVLVIERPKKLKNPKSFMEELEKDPGIASAALSVSLPGRPYGGSTMQVQGRSPEDVVFMAMNFVDEGYLETMGLELLEGRFFSSDYSDNTGSLVINQRAARDLGFDNPVGKYLMLGEEKYYIIGVIENHHFESLHKQIQPLGLRYYKNRRYQYMPVQVNTEDMQATIRYIRDQWESFTRNQPFSYFFLDRDFEQLYASERRTARIFTIFSALAILIACLGLFGLSAFMAEKRTKEIGIRKVMGAKIINILNILYKEVFILLGVSTLIAWPVSYYLMSRWLEDFAFRINWSLTPFVAASLLALVIAMATTSTQALKAAYTNPADTLRDE
jgi:putative ABC transport system permease protein